MARAQEFVQNQMQRQGTNQMARGAAQDPTQIAAAQQYFGGLQSPQAQAQWLQNNPAMRNSFPNTTVNGLLGGGTPNAFGGAQMPDTGMSAGYQGMPFQRRPSVGSGLGVGGAAARMAGNYGGLPIPGLISGMYGNG